MTRDPECGMLDTHDKCLRCGEWPADTECLCDDGPVTVDGLLAAIRSLRLRVAELEEQDL